MIMSNRSEAQRAIDEGTSIFDVARSTDIDSLNQDTIEDLVEMTPDLAADMIALESGDHLDSLASTAAVMALNQAHLIAETVEQFAVAAKTDGINSGRPGMACQRLHHQVAWLDKLRRMSATLIKAARLTHEEERRNPVWTTETGGALTFERAFCNGYELMVWCRNIEAPRDLNWAWTVSTFESRSNPPDQGITPTVEAAKACAIHAAMAR